MMLDVDLPRMKLNERIQHALLITSSCFYHDLSIRSTWALQSISEEVAKSHVQIMDMIDRDYQVDALELARRTLSSAKHRGAGEHEVACCLEDLSRALNSLGQFAESRAILNQAMDIWIIDKKKCEYQIAENMKILSSIEYAIGKYEVADRILKDSLQICYGFTGADRALVADLHELSCLISMARGESRKSETDAQLAIAIREEVLGKSDPSLIGCFDLAATVYLKNGDLDRARSFATRSLALCDTRTRKDQLAMARSLELLGAVEMGRGRQMEALPLYLKSLKIRKIHTNSNSSSIDNVLQTISFIIVKSCDKIDLPAHEETLISWLSLRERVFGLESAELVVSLAVYAEFLEKQDRNVERDRIDARIEKIVTSKKLNSK